MKTWWRRVGQLAMPGAKNCCAALVIFLAWLPPQGFLFGTHWLAMLTVASRPGERTACAVLFAAYITSVVLLGAGGYWVRTSNRYTRCPNNATMTRECMWIDQNTDYAAVYVMHYVFGSVLISAWILDGLSLPGWLWQVTSVPSLPLRTAYSNQPLWASHIALVSLTWLSLCLTWMAIAPWSTSPRSDEMSVGEIALTLFIQAGACFLIGWALLRCLDGRLAKSGAEALNGQP